MTRRPERIEVLMDMAHLVSTRGTCSRLQVGAVVHRDGRVLVTGYNGAPAGLPHCDHTCDCPLGPSDRGMDHLDFCRSLLVCATAQHAERNCVDWAARHGIRLEGAQLVTTDSPCTQCAGSLINAGISTVIYRREYRDLTSVEMMKLAGVSMIPYADVIGSTHDAP